MRRSLLVGGGIVNLMLVIGIVLALDYYGILPWMANPAGSTMLLVGIVLTVSIITALGTTLIDIRI